MTTNKYNSDAASTLTNPTGYVWVVVGETGQYSDYTEWNVAGFETEQLAEEFKNLCQPCKSKMLSPDRIINTSSLDSRSITASLIICSLPAIVSKYNSFTLSSYKT